MENHNEEYGNKFKKGPDMEEKNRLRSECMHDMYTQPGKYFLNTDEDSVMDGLLYFWERIPGMIDRFKPGPCSFKLYCRSSARKYMLTNKVKNYATRVCDTVACKRMDMKDVYEDPEPGDKTRMVDSLDSLKACERKIWQKRIYILALKSAWYLTSQSLIERIAVVVEMDVDLFQDQLQELRLLAEKEIPSFAWLEERRDFWFGKLCVSEQKLRGCLVPEEIEQGELEVRRFRDRLTAANTRIRSLKICPMHIDIARVAGIPKGTVDTVLKRAREYSEEDLKNLFGSTLWAKAEA